MARLRNKATGVVVNVSEETAARLDGYEPADAKPDNGAPAGNASREAWADYARTKGATEDELQPVDDGGLTRDALKDKYGS